MTRSWAALAAAFGITAAGVAQADSGPPDSSAAAVLCDDYRAVEQAALQDFRPMVGKSGRSNPVVQMARGLLASGPSGAKLVLPDADGCGMTSSSLRPGKSAYSCFWKSDQPDWAASDQAGRIAHCLGAAVTKSDFSSDLVVVSAAKVRFTLVIQHAFDHYGVRLLVDGPQ
jgi:hypothetical protein